MQDAMENPMSKVVGAIDQGTTSTRFMVFDHGGGVVASAQREHGQIYPKAGWVEHDAAEIWANTLKVIAEALDKAHLRAADFAGIGITNQRETTVLWNRRTGRPLHNALVWQDMRVEDLVAQYQRKGGPDLFRAQTGLLLATYFSALKLQWLLENVAGVATLATAGDALFGTIDSWLIWNLTGGAKGGMHITDVTNASRTQLMNLATLDWEPELLSAFRIPAAVLPRIVSSAAQHGEIKMGPLAGVALAGILGDQQAALVGQTCFEPGEAKNTYGTGCFLLMNTGLKPVASQAGLITTVAYRFDGEPAVYALEGSVAIAGAVVQWLRDNLRLIESSADIERLALEVEDNGDVYFVPAFSGLYAPHWKQSARGVIAGLTRFANRGHVARAALEATAFQTRDMLVAMEKDAGIRLRELRVDGGMVVNQTLMQFQADILGIDVVRPTVAETTALGAAYAAGLAVGYWQGRADLVANWSVATRWQPQMPASRREQLIGSWQKAITRSLDWTV
jgi:glycerol kinase